MQKDVHYGPESRVGLERHLAALIEHRDYASAIACYEQNRDSLQLSDSDAAAILHHAAIAYASLAKYPVALKVARLAQNALAAVGEGDQLAELFITVGGILRDMGEPKEAQRALRDAESIFRRNDNTEGHCRALNLLAGLHFRQKNFAEALDLLLDAVEAAKQLNDRKKIAFMMGNIGRIYTFQGDFDEAIAHLKTNIELSTELGDRLETARALLSLGYVQIQAERYADAQMSLDKAYPMIIETRSVRDEVIYLTYLGELQYRQGSLDDSGRVLQMALAKAEAIDPNSTLAGRVLRHLAELRVRQAAFASAGRLVNRARAIMDAAGDTVEVGALKKLAGQIADAQDRKETARSQLRAAIQMLSEADVRFERADALLAAGTSSSLSSRRRLSYLFQAQELYTVMKAAGSLRRVDREIAGLNYPTSVSNTTVTADNAVPQNREYLTNSEPIRRFLSQLPLIAKSDIPLLLMGETGVGKDRMARHYHALARPNQPFVAINCTSVPETLLESELFGHKKGAFTGADSDKDGRFVAANGGTLFLDEIGDMPLALQAKLLRVIEERRVTPLGSTKEIPLDVRLVAATNCNLEELVESGRFRRDLYYRLSGISFSIPPLRDRKEDIPLLLQRFLSEMGHDLAANPIPPDLVHRFTAYDWPGNTRELLNKVRRLDVMRQMAAEGDLTELAQTIFPEVAVSTACSSLFDRVEEFERQLLIEALIAAGGNKSQAARMLGIHEATVRTKVKRYGIDLGEAMVQ